MANRIVVGVDLSPESERAVEHAIDRARRVGAEVVLVLAGQVPMAAVPAGDADAVDGAGATEAYGRLLGEQLAADRDQLGRLRDRWLGQGVELTHVVADGFPDEALPQLATETAAELIAVGTHGRTGLKRFALGSVAERVVRQAPCPVIVARGPAPAGGYRRVVVGTDFSPQAEPALTQAIAFAAPRAQVDVVHCWQVWPWVSAPDLGAPVVVDVGVDLLAKVKDDGARLIARLRDRAELDFTFHVLERPIAQGVDEFARESRADLVVVGSHGRRGLRRFVLGSVAEATVRHAPCSVLVAR
jgi:nucleotide-binding universal stress UspA family protein